MTDEKSLLEEILNVKDKKIKNRLLDNDEKNNNEIIEKKVKNKENKIIKTKLQEKFESKNERCYNIIISSYICRYISLWSKSIFRNSDFCLFGSSNRKTLFRNIFK